MWLRQTSFPVRRGWNTVLHLKLKAPGEVSKDVLEAVFAVKVEAGDGMQQPSSIV